MKETPVPKTPMTPREIVHIYTKRKMSTRPEFYSARGAIACDLNSPILEMIFKGVKAEIGEDAAKQFIQMVADIDVLSATHFLNTFYVFGENGWKWERPKKGTKGNAMDHFDFPQGDKERLGSGLASLGAWMGGGADRDETENIRGLFLWNHREEYEAPAGRPVFDNGGGWLYPPNRKS